MKSPKHDEYRIGDNVEDIAARDGRLITHFRPEEQYE
jgi:hypothetical protein